MKKAEVIEIVEEVFAAVVKIVKITLKEEEEE